jgi:hypothetical protein
LAELFYGVIKQEFQFPWLSGEGFSLDPPVFDDRSDPHPWNDLAGGRRGSFRLLCLTHLRGPFPYVD